MKRSPPPVAWLMIVAISLLVSIGKPARAAEGKTPPPRILAQAQRVIAAQGEGYFPVMIKLRDGSLGAAIRGGAPHIGLAGRLDFIRSEDGGRTWSKPVVAIDSPWDDRNPALGQMPDGTLALAYGEAHSYRPDGKFDLKAGPYLPYVVTSNDGGRTWSPKREIIAPWPSPSPFGKMAVCADGTVLMSLYKMPSGVTGLLRSKDSGRTWGDYSPVFQDAHADETQLLELPDGTLAAFTRLEGDREHGLLLSRSTDKGYTWSQTARLLKPGQWPFDVTVLKSGHVLLSHGSRLGPGRFGAGVVLSTDGGKTWDEDHQVLLGWDSLNGDTGYPSTVQLDDGTIVMMYYAVGTASLAQTQAIVVRYTEEQLVQAMSASPQQGAAATGDAWRLERRKAAHRPRRVIFDNDGDDVVYECAEPTEESLLKCRTTGLLGSQVDTIVYCTWSSPFGCFTHATKVGDVFTSKASIFAPNKTEEFLKQGTDPLRIMTGFCRKNRIEIFWSMRMNDTHDAWGDPKYSPYMVSRVKQEHPEYLLGTKEKRTRHGGWTAVDYGRPEVRELAFRYVEEVCRGYDVDGVMLDFFRHPLYFRSHAEGRDATDEERGMMSELVGRIHAMTDEVGRKRGRPVLVAVRAPDSAECSAAIGLDVLRWLKEQWIDVLVVSDYYRLNPWETSVALGRQYDVPVYPSLSESRIRDPEARKVRNSPACYRARAAEAWQAGADGIYIFNYFNPRGPIWRELGDVKTLAGLERVYCASVRGVNPIRSWIPQGERFLHLPTLCPERPLILTAGKPAATEIRLAETLVSSAGSPSPMPDVQMQVRTDGLSSPAGLKVTFNGQPLSEGRISDKSIFFRVDPKTLRAGANQVEFELKPGTSGKPKIQDLLVWVRPSSESRPKTP